MVVGDVVVGVFNAATTMTFQPAATVEIALTCVAAYGQNISLTDGAIVGMIATDTWTNISQQTTKVMINNSIYLTSSAASGNGSIYSGIQIK